MNYLSFILFLTVVLVIWYALNVYVFWRVNSFFGLHGRARRRILIGLVVLFLPYFLGRIWVDVEPLEGLGRVLEMIGAVWIGFVVILLGLILLIEIGAALVLGLSAISRDPVFLWRRLRKFPLLKRRALGCILLCFNFVLAIVAHYVAHAEPQITRLDIVIPERDYPSALFENRFVAFADFHAGATMSDRFWDRSMARLEALSPHALLIAGDFVDDHSRHGLSHFERLRKAFEHIPIYASVGNHEYYVGISDIEKAAERADIHLLRQACLPLADRIKICGIDDPVVMDSEKAVEKTLAQVSPVDYMLILSHRAQSALPMANRGRAVVISGHTHGGQIFPFQLLSYLGNRFMLSGLFHVKNIFIYVTTGMGMWGPPMRLLAPPEILLIQFFPGDQFEVIQTPVPKRDKAMSGIQPL